MFTCYEDIIGLHSLRREQQHNITLKHGCGFSYSLDQGTTIDMPIHIELLCQAAECEPIAADFHSGFSVIPKWRHQRFGHFQYLLAIHCAIVEQIVIAIVNEYEKMIQHIGISKKTHL